MSRFINAQFSQGDETECDEYGLHLLASKNLPKDAAVSALLKLGGDSDAEKTSNDFFASLTSSHPDPVSRAQHLQEMIPELAGQPLPIQVAKNNPPSQAASASNKVVSAQLPSDELGQDVTTGAQDQSLPKVVQASSDSGEQTRHEITHHGSWYIQVGAFGKKDSARAFQRSLIPSSKATALHEGKHSGQAIYRILVGPFNSRAQAQQELTQVTSGSSSLSDAFVRKL